MKTNEFKKIINRLVSEEVKKQLGEIFINEIKSKRSTPIQESVKTPGQEDYPTLGGTPFTTNNMADLLGHNMKQSNGAGMSNQGYAEIARKAGVNPDQVNPEVQKAITKDYRELMSKLNLKK